MTAQNVVRAARWHPGFPTEDDWTGGDWAAAMAGECGEACNVVKKLRRIETAKRGRPSEQDAEALRAALGDELADLIIYADLLAAKYGVDLPTAIRDKFNSTSEQYGFPESLGEIVCDCDSSVSSAAHVHEWDTDSDEFSTFTPDPALYENPWVIHECLTVGCLAIKVTRVLRDQPVEIIYEEGSRTP